MVLYEVNVERSNKEGVSGEWIPAFAQEWAGRLKTLPYKYSVCLFASAFQHLRSKIQRGKEVIDCLCASDQFYRSMGTAAATVEAEASRYNCLPLPKTWAPVSCCTIISPTSVFGSSRCFANLSLFSHKGPTTSTISSPPCFGFPAGSRMVMW